MPTPQERSDLKTNLRHLCTFRKSASHVARGIGINRQQFEKYLTGASFPHPYTLRRIGDYFGVSTEELTGDPHVLKQTYGARSVPPARHQFDIPESTPEELSILRNYEGLYQSHFMTPAWPGHIYIALVQVRQDGQKMRTIFMNRVRDPNTGALYRSRFDGILTLRGERLFLIEKSRHTNDRFAETILFPPQEHSAKYLNGMAFGVTWRPHRMPFASRLIWRRVSASRSARSVMRECGIYRPTHRLIDPIVRNFMGDNLTTYSMDSV